MISPFTDELLRSTRLGKVASRGNAELPLVERRVGDLAGVAALARVVGLVFGGISDGQMRALEEVVQNARSLQIAAPLLQLAS